MALSEESAEEDDLEWSDGLYTVSQIAEQYDLPCLVRVAEGIYSTEDTGSFSNGDFLKLHKSERVEKVVAYPIESYNYKRTTVNNYRMVSSPLLIPLDYRKKARVLQPRSGKRYPTVEALLQDFPRFVEVGPKPIYGRHLHTREIVEVPARSPVELIRTTKNLTTKSTTLICSHDRHQLELESDCRGDFVAVKDPTSYTFREIVNTFCLPQLIELPRDFIQDEKFVTEEASMALANMERFEGQFMLDRVDAEFKAFGTHRLDLGCSGDTETAEKYTDHQAVVIIPFTSDAQFQVVTNRETSDYQSIISLHFQADLNTVNLGNLYVEVEGSSKSQTVDPDYCYPDLRTLTIPDFYEGTGSPPPRPPRRTPLSGSPASNPSPSSSRPPERPPRHLASKPHQSTNISGDRGNQTGAPPKPPTRPSVRQYIQVLPPLPKAWKRQPKSTPQPKEPVIGKAEKHGQKTKPSASISPQQGNAPTTTTTPPPAPVPPRGRRMERQGTYLQPTCSGANSATNQKSPYEEHTLLAPPSTASKPGGTSSAWSQTLRTYSVQDVKKCLLDLGLGEKAEVFVQMEIDGDYLLAMCSQQDNVLQDKPFSLSSVEIMKLMMFVSKGKLPLREKKYTLIDL